MRKRVISWQFQEVMECRLSRVSKQRDQTDRGGSVTCASPGYLNVTSKSFTTRYYYTYVYSVVPAVTNQPLKTDPGASAGAQNDQS